MAVKKNIKIAKENLQPFLNKYTDMLVKGLVSDGIIRQTKSPEPTYELAGTVQEKISIDELIEKQADSQLVKDFLEFRAVFLNVYTYLKNPSDRKISDIPLYALIKEYEELGVITILKGQKTLRFAEIINKAETLLDDEVIKQDAIKIFKEQNINFSKLIIQLLEYYTKKKAQSHLSELYFTDILSPKRYNKAEKEDLIGRNYDNAKSDFVFEIKSRKKILSTLKENLFQAYEYLDQYDKQTQKNNYLVLVLFTEEVNPNFDNAKYRFRQNLEELFPQHLSKIFFVPVSTKNIHLIDGEFIQIKSKIIESGISSIIFQKTSTFVTRDQDKAVSTNFLNSTEGAFSAWVRLKPTHQFYNTPMNNEYIFSHSTNYFANATKGKYNYPNVFSISLTPNVFDDTGRPPTEVRWKLWISNSDSQDFQIIGPKIPNTYEWFHLLVRWDHSKPSLDFFVNGVLIGNKNNYLDFWPKEFKEIAFIGTWGSKDPKFYINAPLYRVINSFYFLDDNWIKSEQSYKPLS